MSALRARPLTSWKNAQARVGHHAGLGAGAPYGACGRARKSTACRPHQRSARDAPGAHGPSEEAAQKGNPRRVSGFLKALDGETAQDLKGASAEPAPAAAKPAETSSAEAVKPSRRARLLERITGLDKTSA